MDVPGSSPYLVIDADGDSGFTASVESKFWIYGFELQYIILLF